MKYRPEIDGLRSVAVVPVILFHAGFSIFSGGYVGVDVFFVISGYLITTILIDERDKGTYSIWGFYERRARRILPALFVVLLFTIPVAWRWIPPEPFEDYARSLSYAAMFMSNIHFLEKSDYWDVAAELRPLLHTWSLAVEEQYYLLFPLVLFVLGRFSRRRFMIAFLVLSVLSLGLAEWGWRNLPAENFFFSPSRLWELLAGSICAVILFRREQLRNEVIALAGLAMILGSVFFYDGAVPFPSVYTLLPVVGTALVILFADKGTITARLLSLKPMVGIGLISYSAYLWHQPLLAFARIRSVAEPSLLLMSGLVLATLVLAYLTWLFIETPFRKRTLLTTRRAALSASAAGILLFVGLGSWGDETKGFPGRVDQRETEYTAGLRAQTLEKNKMNCRPSAPAPGKKLRTVCSAKNPTSSVAMIGDSHAHSILPAFAELARSKKLTLLASTKAGCPPLLGIYLAYGGEDADECFAYANSLAVEVVESGVETVVIAARWSVYASGDYDYEVNPYMVSRLPGNRMQSRGEWQASYVQGVRNTLAFYRSAGLRVVLLAQVPQQWVDPDRVIINALIQGLDESEIQDRIRSSFIEKEKHDELVEFAEGELRLAAEEFGAEIMTLTEYFEEGDRFAWFRDGDLLYRDSNHLSPRGSLKIAPLVIKKFGGE